MKTSYDFIWLLSKTMYFVYICQVSLVLSVFEQNHIATAQTFLLLLATAVHRELFLMLLLYLYSGVQITKTHTETSLS